MITIDLVKQRVAAIHVVSEFLEDERSAIKLEGELYESVLRAIARDPFQAQILAHEALQVKDVKFRR